MVLFCLQDNIFCFEMIKQSAIETSNSLVLVIVWVIRRKKIVRDYFDKIVPFRMMVVFPIRQLVSTNKKNLFLNYNCRHPNVQWLTIIPFSFIVLYANFRSPQKTAGPGCRDPSYLRRDEVPSSRLASLDTSERNYWVARVPRIIQTSHVRLSL